MRQWGELLMQYYFWFRAKGGIFQKTTMFLLLLLLVFFFFFFGAIYLLSTFLSCMSVCLSVCLSLTLLVFFFFFFLVLYTWYKWHCVCRRHEDNQVKALTTHSLPEFDDLGFNWYSLQVSSLTRLPALFHSIVVHVVLLNVLMPLG